MAGLGFATSKAWANARRRPFGSRCCALFYAPNTPLPQLFYRPADSRVVNAQMGGNILHAEMARRIGINHTLPDIVTVKILAQWFGQCTALGAWDFRVVQSCHLRRHLIEERLRAEKNLPGQMLPDRRLTNTGTDKFHIPPDGG
jgi:hypothetical protein